MQTFFKFLKNFWWVFLFIAVTFFFFSYTSKLSEKYQKEIEKYQIKIKELEKELVESQVKINKLSKKIKISEQKLTNLKKKRKEIKPPQTEKEVVKRLRALGYENCKIVDLPY